MLKIDFKNVPINFFNVNNFSKQKNIPNYTILKQAYDQNLILDDKEDLFFGKLISIRNIAISNEVAIRYSEGNGIIFISHK